MDEGSVIHPETHASINDLAPPIEPTKLFPEDPIGIIDHFIGSASITRADGSVVPASEHISIYQNDIIDTEPGSQVGLKFIDESEFSVREDSKLTIDEYIFDPDADPNGPEFNWLRGVFVFTSGCLDKLRGDKEETEPNLGGGTGIRG